MFEGLRNIKLGLIFHWLHMLNCSECVCRTLLVVLSWAPNIRPGASILIPFRSLSQATTRFRPKVGQMPLLLNKGGCLAEGRGIVSWAISGVKFARNVVVYLKPVFYVLDKI